MSEIIDLKTKAIEQTKNTNITGREKEDLHKIKKACKDFESVFTYYLFKTMRQTIPQNTLLGNMSGKGTYNMLMDQKVAEELSNKGGGLGLQKILFEQLTKNYTKEAIQKD